MGESPMATLNQDTIADKILRFVLGALVGSRVLQ